MAYPHEAVIDVNNSLSAESLVITDDEDVYGVKDGSTKLTCVLTSSKDKKIFWYKDGDLQGG